MINKYTKKVLLGTLLLCGLGMNCIAETTQSKPKSVNAGSIDQLLVGLRQRLEKEPNDVGGWVLLAKSYHHLDRWHEAEKAAAKARALGFKGDIFPGERSIAPNSHIKGHQNAGSMVSSFFEQQEDDPAQTTKPNKTKEH